MSVQDPEEQFEREQVEDEIEEENKKKRRFVAQHKQNAPGARRGVKKQKR